MKNFGLYLIVLLFLFAGCRIDDDYLSDYNKDELFTPVTTDEINAVKSDWELRDLTPSDYEELEIVELSDNQTILKLVSYRIDGLREYAALLVPLEGSDLPVKVYLGGFGLGITENSVAIESNQTAANKSILAIPALRGQSLKITIEGKTYVTPTSEGIHCDAFDGAADDGIGLLNLIELTEKRANVNRTAVRGGSRGATVSLLMAERDNRVKMAFAIAGPTDLLGMTSINENDPTYQCQFLEDLVQNGGTIEEARKKMIASSPLYFASDLPLAQLHLGEKDPIVPLSEGEKLQFEITRLGNQEHFELFIYEERGHVDISLKNELLNQRIDSLMSQL